MRTDLYVCLWSACALKLQLHTLRADALQTYDLDLDHPRHGVRPIDHFHATFQLVRPRERDLEDSAASVLRYVGQTLFLST